MDNLKYLTKEDIEWAIKESWNQNLIDSRSRIMAKSCNELKGLEKYLDFLISLLQDVKSKNSREYCEITHSVIEKEIFHVKKQICTINRGWETPKEEIIEKAKSQLEGLEAYKLALKKEMKMKILKGHNIEKLKVEVSNVNVLIRTIELEDRLV